MSLMKRWDVQACRILSDVMAEGPVGQATRGASGRLEESTRSKSGRSSLAHLASAWGNGMGWGGSHIGQERVKCEACYAARSIITTSRK